MDQMQPLHLLIQQYDRRQVFHHQHPCLSINTVKVMLLIQTITSTLYSASVVQLTITLEFWTDQPEETILVQAAADKWAAAGKFIAPDMASIRPNTLIVAVTLSGETRINK